MTVSIPAIRMTFPHFGESFVARGQAPLQPCLWLCVRHQALALAYRKQVLPRCSVHSLHEAESPAIGRSPPQHSLHEWYDCMRANASAIVIVSLMYVAPCPCISLQDKCNDAFPCPYLFPLTHGDKWLIPITSQEVGRIFLHAFPKKHVCFSVARPPPREVGRIFLHAFPSEACLALCSESAIR